MATERKAYPYKSDSVIEFVAPVDVIAGNPLDNTTDGATSTFKVYDPAKDESLTTVASLGAGTLSVSGAGAFVVGDSIELTQDDGSLHSTTLTAVDAAAGTVGLTDVTTVAAASGNRCRVIFGASVAMAEYGTPVLGSRDYGFRGLLADTHAVTQILGQIFDIEINFSGAAGGGLNLIDVLCGVVKMRSECPE